jgi:hypothetical protein
MVRYHQEPMPSLADEPAGSRPGKCAQMLINVYHLPPCRQRGSAMIRSLSCICVPFQRTDGLHHAIICEHFCGIAWAARLLCV